LIVGVIVTRVQELGGSVIHRDVGAPGNMAGVEERDLVAGRLERFVVTVAMGDLGHPLDLRFGERAVVPAAAELEGVPREQERQLFGGRCPMDRRPTVPREQRRDRSDVVEVAVGDADGLRLRCLDRKGGRVAGQRSEIQQ
jgi:hypothetical protein